MQDSNVLQIRIINGAPGLISPALGNVYRILKKGCVTRYFKEPRGAGRPGNLFMIAALRSILSVPASFLQKGFAWLL